MTPTAEPVQIPQKLLEKMDSTVQPGVLGFNCAVSELLLDNKLPFFPNYTDHGVMHVSRLLHTIVDQLIPDDVLSYFTPDDVAVLVCASLLHDLAMHLKEDGFVQLIRGETPHQPIAWFDEGAETREPDLKWPEEWLKFRSQVRRFSDHDFFWLFGHLPAAADLTYWLRDDLHAEPINWAPSAPSDYLLVGEFLRRHHGRLAHEIAIKGFPGLSAADFPVLERTIPKLANIAGVVARSHSLPLREAANYLNYKHPKDLRPRGVLVLYHMALLRIGDYLQIDADRAPRILFKLRSPKAPASVDAWNQHGAVADISYIVDDPVAIKVELDANHSLKTHLQLRHLIDDLQGELDTCSAVLSELYGRVSDSAMKDIRLKRRRVYSNHNDRALLDGLKYIPKAFGFDADPRILSLMVEPIYGQFPEFGVRELLQNAVDAVLERRQYLANRGQAIEASTPDGEPDVLVELIEDAKKDLVITVTDKGVGMTAETVQDYFLRAGASFRDSRRWREEFTDGEGRSRIRRSGRFGVGVFAGFLLGDTMEVKTRHVGSKGGLSFVATISSDLIELKKVDLPVGTSISIRLSKQNASTFVAKSWASCASWYGLADPAVVFRRVAAGSVEPVEQRVIVTEPELRGEAPDWKFFSPEGFAKISWTIKESIDKKPANAGGAVDDVEEVYARSGVRIKKVYCNGFLIGAPIQPRETEEPYSTFGRTSRVERGLKPATYGWEEGNPFAPPNLLITDNQGALPLTLRRDQLVDQLPFQKALERDIILDFVAWCLATAPSGPVWSPLHTQSYLRRYPLLRKQQAMGSTFSWVCSDTGVGPLSRHLLEKLRIRGMLIAGTMQSVTDPRYAGRLLSSKGESPLVININGKWPENRSINLEPSILAIGLPDHRSEVRFSEETGHLDGMMTKALIEYLNGMRNSQEFTLQGAVIVKYGPGGNAKPKVDAGDYFEPQTNLSGIIGPPPRVAEYYAWGHERENINVGADFVGELAVTATQGNGMFSEVWDSIVGSTLIPFDEGSRRERVQEACRIANIGERVDKWTQRMRADIQNFE